MSFDQIYDLVCGPFVEFSFMRRALVGTLALALSSAPLGVFLTLRRMSLFGDALSHAVLPGVAVAFIYFGLSLTALSIGGLIAGMAVVTITGYISRHTNLKEDASLTAGYLSRSRSASCSSPDTVRSLTCCISSSATCWPSMLKGSC